MKAVTAPLAPLDGNALPLDADAAESNDAAPGAGFDALLALVNAQAATVATPVKALAQSVGLQCAAPEAAKGSADASDTSANAAKSSGPALLNRKRGDVGPTQAFLPWLAPELPDAGSAAKLDLAVVDAKQDRAQVLPTEPAADTKTQLASAPAQVEARGQTVQARGQNTPVVAPQLKAPSSLLASDPTPALKDAAVAPTVEAKGSAVQPKAETKEALKGPAVRKSAARDGDELLTGAKDAAPAPSPSQALPSLLAQTPLQAKANGPVVTPASTPSRQSEIAPAALSARGPAPSAPMVSAPNDDDAVVDVTAPVFSDVLAVQSDVVAAPSAANSAPAPSAANSAPAPSAAHAPIPMANKETGAVVTKIEFYETKANSDVKELPAAPLHAEPAHVAEGEATSEDAPSLDSESQSDDAASSEREQAAEPVPLAPAPRFEVTEGKGMRGLDAVVASLLRPYQEKSESKAGARVATASAPHISVETGKSQNIKVEERVANVTQALDAAALRREEEDRRGDVRESLELAAPHLPHHVELQPDLGAPSEAAPPAAPVAPAPPVLPDPDAAMMGKLSRGESLNAAISIEHPELGSMDVVVQSENGRIDVRATLDTPRAAAVLRAHESALRYGVQQAGMTFGALRVNARTGDTKIEKSRDVLKRRRDRDWEA